MGRNRRSKKSENIVSWIYNQLCEENPCVEWVDRLKLRFQINDPNKLASLWGKRKKNDAMDFDKFSRTLRYHYAKSKNRELVPNRKKLIYELSPDAPFLRKKDITKK